jgi:hypothetical protein
VVAIPLPDERPKIKYFPINLLSSESIALIIGMDVYVLGYPFAPSGAALPIWKRGSIASEPHLDTGSGVFLIDSASRPGMSGSAVILRKWGERMLEDGSTLWTLGAATRLIGVYSGRLHTQDQLEAQLGMVWPVRLIEEIINGTTRDSI